MQLIRGISVVGVLVGAASVVMSHAWAAGARQQERSSLAKVVVPVAVWANGRPLSAGTYELRPATSLPEFAEGQTVCGSCWLEFVQDGEVRGQEQATILAEGDTARFIAGTRPEPDSARVDVLGQGSYVRIWINRDHTDYVISLPVAP